MEILLKSSAFLLSLHAAIFLAVAVRVVIRRSARGIALSWLLLVATLPYAGALIYLLIGERRIGRKRSRGINALRTDFREVAKATIPADFTTVDWQSLPPAAQAMDRLGRSLSAVPPFRQSIPTFFRYPSDPRGDRPRCRRGEDQHPDRIQHLERRRGGGRGP